MATAVLPGSGARLQIALCLAALAVSATAAASSTTAAQWPTVCNTNATGLASCWPTCQVRCPPNWHCCKTPYTAQLNGMGCCSTKANNPNREPGCKAGAPLPLSTDLPNVVVIGDSVYTPWVAKHLGVGNALVQHSPWGDGSPYVSPAEPGCNRSTTSPCDQDPTRKYTGDGGAEETAYGIHCLDFFTAHPDGTALQGTAAAPLLIMFNWGLHDGPLGNATHHGQQGNSSVYGAQLKVIATRLSAFCPAQQHCKLLFALTSAMICKVRANDNVASLNAQAAVIMGALSIPSVNLQVRTMLLLVLVLVLLVLVLVMLLVLLVLPVLKDRHLQAAIVQKCAPGGLPVHSCFNIRCG